MSTFAYKTSDNTINTFFSCKALFTSSWLWFKCVTFLLFPLPRPDNHPFPPSLVVRRCWDNVLRPLCPQQTRAAGQNLAGSSLGQEVDQGSCVWVQSGEQCGEHHLTQGHFSWSWLPQISCTVCFDVSPLSRESSYNKLFTNEPLFIIFYRWKWL